MEKDLKLPEGWNLYKSKEFEVRGVKYFWNRYVHREAKSGISYYSTFMKEKKVFIVEGYGIGTIDPDTFREIADFAPIERFESDDEETAEKNLVELMEENNKYWRKHSNLAKIFQDHSEILHK